MYIDGNAYEDDEVFSKHEDTTSKAAYGESAIAIDSPYVGQFGNIDAYAQWLLSRYKDTQPDFVQIHIVNSTSAILTQQLTREISDRITLTVGDLGISAKDFFINKMQHTLDMGGMLLKSTWWVERVDETKYWLLETTGYGELEQYTKVGF